MKSSNVSTHNQQSWWRQIIWSCESLRGPLLTRYFLIRTRWFGVYLHCFHTADDQRAMHDHPWGYIVFLFHRGYHEQTPSGYFFRPRFSILVRPATSIHAVFVERPTWTFLLRGPIRRQWGFHTKTGWMHWREYGQKFCD